MDDTRPELDDRQIEIYRRMTGAERLAIAMEMSNRALDAARAQVLEEHPGWTNEQANIELFRRAISPEPLPPALARRLSGHPR